MKISVIIPCYNSEKTIGDVVEAINSVMRKNRYDHELILVNDCSKDETWKKICFLSDRYPHVRGLDLSKNCGQHSAIMAGMRNANGDIVMCSDDDGQTPVENIPLLVNGLLEGRYDVVSAKYVKFEKKNLWRRLGTICYKEIIKLTMDQPTDLELRVFFAAKKYVIDEIIKYNQPYTSINGLILRVTHNIGNVDMVQHARKTGRSGYSLRKLLYTWLNSFTAFSIVPLRLAGGLGLLTSFIGFIFLIFIVSRKILNPEIQVGWSSIIAIILLMFGIVMFILYIIGEYIGRMYMCINGTPQYVIKDTVGYKK